MISSRKPVNSYNGMLVAYEESCVAITKSYCNDMDKFTEDSVRALCSLFQSYLQKKKDLQNYDSSILGKSTTDDNSQNSSVGCSQKNNGQAAGILKSQGGVKKVGMGKIGDQSMVASDKPIQAKIQKEYLLIEDDESEEDSPTKRNSPPKEFKNKDIAEIIMQSQKKIQEKFENQNKDGKIRFFESEESEYGLSDFSNKDGSDEFDEEPHYLSEEEATNKPLFGGLFSKTQESESNNSCTTKMMSFNFTSKQLLKSPKKAAKQKRVYIGSKKIPQWAQDMQKVNSLAAKQDKNVFVDIFGKIVVEHLDTNVIFRGEKENILRTSSAKWNNIFLI